MNLNPLFNEMKEVLIQEVDFEQEALYLKKYRKNIQTINTESEKYYSPEAYPGMCTKKVITMSWEEGISINKWILTNPTKKKKEKLAHLILNLYCHEFYHWGLVQTDPNFANFLVREDGNDIGLVLLDFGATREYEKEFRVKYLDLIDTVRLKDRKLIIQKAIDFNLIDHRESDESYDLFIELMNLGVEPFFPDVKNTKFSFGNQEYNLKTKEVVKKFLLTLKYSPPPHRLLFLHRKLGGISSLLRRLDVELDLAKYWNIMFEKKI